MEVRQDERDSPAAGFGIDGKPDFWIGGEGELNRAITFAIAGSAAVDAFYRAAIAAGARDNGAPGLRPSTTRITTALLCLILMVTTSRPSATRPLETKPEVLDVSRKVDAGIKLCNFSLNQKVC